MRPESIIEDADQLRAELRQFLTSRPDLSPISLQQHTTLSESSVRNFISGNLPGGREVITELRGVLTLARSGDILQPGGSATSIVLTENPAARVRRVIKRRNFYQTQTVERVAEVLDYCAETNAIGVVTADFGVGKTEAVKAWRRGAGRKIDHLIFEFDEFTCANKVDFIQQVAAMLGIDCRSSNQTAGRIFRGVCEHLRDHPTLLIFDQCETVRPRVCQVIRQIWDHTSEYGVGVVLLAAPILLSRMTGSRMIDLGALTSRVGVWAPLNGMTRSEMAAIVKQEGLAEVDEDAFDLWWRATAGSMRRLMRSIDLLKAKHSGKRVTIKTVTGVAGYLWGMRIGDGEAL